MTSDDTETRHLEIGMGSTPYEAARDLVPGPDVDYIGWIEGLRGIDDHPDPPGYDNAVTRELTIIYEDRPSKQWRVELEAVEDGWRAHRAGSKRV